jgi:hypothetical protein
MKPATPVRGLEGPLNRLHSILTGDLRRGLSPREDHPGDDFTTESESHGATIQQ